MGQSRTPEESVGRTRSPIVRPIYSGALQAESGPSPVRGAMCGKDLQFVYLSQCYGGRKSAEWQQALAPAEIVTFDRLSTDLEALWWLLVEAPQRLQEVR